MTIKWPAKCIYLTQVGKRYAVLAGEKSELSISRFFGFFFMVFQTSQIWGNLISSIGIIFIYRIKKIKLSFYIIRFNNIQFYPWELIQMRLLALLN